MTGNLPSTQIRRAAGREKLTTHRLRVRTIRRRVAGMSLAVFLAASGAVLVTTGSSRSQPSLAAAASPTMVTTSAS